MKCCFTSTETVGLLGTEAQDGHLDFHTAPEFGGLGPSVVVLQTLRTGDDVVAVVVARCVAVDVVPSVHPATSSVVGGDGGCTDIIIIIIIIIIIRNFIYNAPVPVLQKGAPSTVQLHISLNT